MTTATVTTAVLAALASWLWARPPSAARVRRLRGPRPRRPRWMGDPGLVLRLAGAGSVAATAWLVLHGRSNLVLIALVAVFVGWSALTLRARARRAAQRRRRRAETVELCDALAAELSAGAAPDIALRNIGRDFPVVEPAAAVARLGGDVAYALRGLATTPGNEGLRHLAASWGVSVRSGSALSTTLGRLSVTLRDEQEAQREITASLGSARATARLLAVLPLLGLALGTGIGSDPWSVLTESLLGAVCLASGAVLAVTGVFWVERIAERAEAGP